MAEVKNLEESTFPTKRTPDVSPLEPASEPKKPKLTTTNSNGNDSPLPQNDAVSNQQVVEDPPKETQKESEEEADNGKAAIIDRKGKGILIEDEQEDENEDDSGDEDDSDSDSDSSSDSGIGDGLEDDDSDFADDPLAEVDPDNILPSRTRRKTIHPGVYLATDLPPEDSDDSDA